MLCESKNLMQQKDRRASATLSHIDEIKDLANGLYRLSAAPSSDGHDYSEMATGCAFLYDMIKYGMVQPNTAKKIAELGEQKAADKESSRAS